MEVSLARSGGTHFDVVERRVPANPMMHVAHCLHVDSRRSALAPGLNTTGRSPRIPGTRTKHNRPHFRNTHTSDKQPPTTSTRSPDTSRRDHRRSSGRSLYRRLVRVSRATRWGAEQWARGGSRPAAESERTLR